VESNRTQNFNPRPVRRLHHGPIIAKIYGVPESSVQVRNYYNEDPTPFGLQRENLQRLNIINGWLELGMTRDDIGFITDVDETFHRDCLMSDDTSAAAGTVATAASSAVSSVTTRSQYQKNEEKMAATSIDDDGNNASLPTDKNRKKEHEPFKGKSDKMGGNVFQTEAEGWKANQFSETLKALRDYANVELENPQDLAPWFDEPCGAVVLQEPPRRAPSSEQWDDQGRPRPLQIHPMEVSV
jgi:hypothetical protein